MKRSYIVFVWVSLEAKPETNIWVQVASQGKKGKGTIKGAFMSRLPLWTTEHNPTGDPQSDFTEHTTHLRNVPLKAEAPGEFICQLPATLLRGASGALNPQ